MSEVTRSQADATHGSVLQHLHDDGGSSSHLGHMVSSSSSAPLHNSSLIVCVLPDTLGLQLTHVRPCFYNIIPHWLCSDVEDPSSAPSTGHAPQRWWPSGASRLKKQNRLGLSLGGKRHFFTLNMLLQTKPRRINFLL